MQPAILQAPEIDYFQRPEVSNSDLSWLREELLSIQEKMDFTNAYRMGSLIDAMITENHRVNYFKFQLLDYPHHGHAEQFTADEFETCKRMKVSFLKDEFCKTLLKQCCGQKIMSSRVDLRYDGIDFYLSMRIKYDLWSDLLRWGGDVKSTTATSQKQFEEAVRHWDYDRQRAVYMSVSGAKKDMIIGISKINYKVFKIPVSRDSEIFKSGMEKFSDLGFKYWYLFENI